MRSLVVLNVAALLAAVRFLNGGLDEFGGDNVRFLLLAEAVAGGHGLVDLSLVGNPPAPGVPPLYPLLLTPWVWAGAPLLLLKAFTAALGVAGLNVCYFLVTRWHDPGVALLAMLSTLCCGAFLDPGFSVMSESPYLLLSAAAMLLVQMAFDSRERRTGLCVAAGAAVALGMLTRLIGIVMVPAVFLHAVFVPCRHLDFGERLRRMALVTVAAAVLAAPWVAWSVSSDAKATAGYLAELLRGNALQRTVQAGVEVPSEGRTSVGTLLARPLYNLRDLGARLGYTAMPESVRSLGPGWTRAVSVGFLATCALLAFLSLAGLCLGLRSRARAHDSYALGYLAVLSLWVGGGFRLTMPLLPFLITYVYEAVVALCGRRDFSRRVGRAVLLFSIAANLAVTLSFPRIRDRLEGRYESWWGDLLTVSCRLREWSHPGDTVIGSPGNVVFYLSGLEAVRIPLTGEKDAVLVRLLESDATYVVSTPFEDWRYRTVRAAMRAHPDLFPVILTAGEVRVHRIARARTEETAVPVDAVSPRILPSRRCQEVSGGRLP